MRSPRWLRFSGALLSLAGLGAAPPALSDYYQCVDESGTSYRFRQDVGARFGFFQRCDLVREVEPPKPVIDTTTTIVLPPPPGKPLRIARTTKRPDSRLRTLIQQVAREHRLDPHLLTAIVRVESGFNAHAISPKGARGLMQMMPATAKRYGVSEPRRLSDPGTNLRAGARYLNDLFRQFENRLDLVLAAYNAGEESVRSRGFVIPPFPETQSYVVSVMREYDANRRAH